MRNCKNGGCCFNPLPLPKQGETRDGSCCGLGLTGFQSAPLTEARGDSAPAAQHGAARGFNPLPLPKQGETNPIDPCGLADSVSIRSPYRSKGRPQMGISCTDVPTFQSAPLTEARGDQ